MSTICTQGVIRNGRIELDREVSVPEGTRVTLTIQPTPMTRDEMERLVDEHSGWGKADPTFIAALEQAVRERKLAKPRDVDFDAAS